MTTKRNNTTHNEVVVERVLTSDAFLTRRNQKSPHENDRRLHS